MSNPTLKQKSSFHRLKQRIGLDKDKKLPPPPLTPSDVPGDSSGRSSLDAHAHAAPRKIRRWTDPVWITRTDVTPRGSNSRHDKKVRTYSALALIWLALTSSSPLLPPARISRPSVPPLEPPPAPAASHLRPMVKKVNALQRITMHFKSGRDTTSPPDTVEPTARPALKLSLREKAPHQEADLAAKARREEALRARGLRPLGKTKYLSDIEAEENRRVGVVPLPQSDPEGPSVAAALVDSWRAKNSSEPTDSQNVRTNTLAPAPASPAASPQPAVVTPPASPRKETSETTRTTPRSTRSRKSEDASPSHAPAQTEAAEKVAQWLQRSPPPSPRRVPRPRDSEGDRLAAFTMPRGPRAPPMTRTSVDTTRSSMEVARTSVEAARTSAEVARDQPAPASPLPIMQTFSDASSHRRAPSTSEQSHLMPPPSPILPSSSSEASCSASTEPLTPSTASHSLTPRARGTTRGPPAGMAPIIIETAEEGILRDERGILAASPEACTSEFGKNLPPVPQSAPVPGATLRPPGRGKGERRSLGFLFSKPVRSATLEPEQSHGLSGARSAGDLRRGITLSARSRAGAEKRLNPPSAMPVTPLAPTMHSQSSIADGVQFIADDESRRLSELAFVC
ncbi:hypothetical protein K488DRAFT_83071 [Vararia minispora EC-137]|uniref:Uncharacterized protein n=1 Tax=Vararia minispora EC-137 TaxID=1314806 RepID=A0ACB8QUC7_9AGAM|nr:hypothetical protein K488DRAFT_83071 [Vararia minispora EC-137]